ncbi:MAG: hypothetical protein ACM3PP_00320 [Candidatus Saccharibacteria bacterium]
MAMSSVGALHSGKNWPIRSQQNNAETSPVEQNQEQSFRKVMHETMHDIKKDVKDAHRAQNTIPDGEAAADIKHRGHGYIRVDDIQRALETEVASFEDDVNKLLSELDGDTDNPINLTYKDGKLAVGEDNPDQAIIEEALAGKPDLIKSFFETVFLNGIANEGQEAGNQGYAKNPRVALAQFGHIFSKDSLDKYMIQLQYQDTKWNVQVKPVAEAGTEGEEIPTPPIDETEATEAPTDPT